MNKNFENLELDDPNIYSLLHTNVPDALDNHNNLDNLDNNIDVSNNKDYTGGIVDNNAIDLTLTKINNKLNNKLDGIVNNCDCKDKYGNNIDCPKYKKKKKSNQYEHMTNIGSSNSNNTNNMSIYCIIIIIIIVILYFIFYYKKTEQNIIKTNENNKSIRNFNNSVLKNN